MHNNEMKCKIHPYDQSGGVCASCLRNRLLDLQASPSPELRLRHPPPPSLLARSASPRRRSSSSNTSSAVSDRRRRFHRTPQIDRRESNSGCQRFSLSWLSSLIHRARKKKKNNVETLKVSPPRMTMRKRRSCTVSDRGMSPQDDLSESGYSTESSSATWRRQTPSRRSTSDIRGRHGGGFSGVSLCFSPLVGPTCRRDLGGFSGELNRHVAGGGVSFGPNRSRKLADRGRRDAVIVSMMFRYT